MGKEKYHYVFFSIGYPRIYSLFSHFSTMHAHTHNLQLSIIANNESSAEPIGCHGFLASQIYTYEKITSFSYFRPQCRYLGRIFLKKMNAGVYAHR
jgi:hypothetical protein